MKLRSKLLLSATCLLTISVAATATSAYAWFTANRQAFVSVTNMKVNSKTDKVFIEPATAPVQSNNVKVSTTDKTTLSGAATTIGTDISGDGKTFYKPSFKDATATKVNSVATVTNPTSVTNVYYHEFSATFTHENTNINTGLFLSVNSTIEKTSGEKDLSGAYRVAILDGDTLIAYFAPKDKATDLIYVHTAALTDDNQLQTQNVEAGKIGLSGIYASNVLGSEFKALTDIDDSTSGSKGTAAVGYLGLIGDGRTLTFRVWCEGTDTECKNANLSSNSPVDVSLVFNGVTMKA